MNMNVSQVSVGTSGLNSSTLNTSTRFSNSVVQGRQQGAQQNQTGSQQSSSDGQSKGVVAGGVSGAVQIPVAKAKIASQKNAPNAKPESGNWRRFYQSSSYLPAADMNDRLTMFKAKAMFASVKGTAAASSSFRNARAS